MLAACGSDSDGEAPINYPSTYAFDSKVVDGESSVKFTGQAARQLLISELKSATGNAEIDQADLEAIYSTGTSSLDDADIYGDVGRVDTAVNVSLPQGFSLAQTGYREVYGYDGDLTTSAGSKKLSDKTAGCDNDLSADQFIGWAVSDLEPCDGTSVTTYHDSAYTLMNDWIIAAANGKVDADLGLDYAQLFQKFMLGAVTFSQTAEDYLAADHVKTGKGLKADNTAGSDAYTDLEHAWDEGFGYFGASVDYLDIDDATISGGTYHSDVVVADTIIDLLKGEYNYGLAVYASKHDVMTTTTDLSKDIMVAFLEGRQLIVDNHGTTPVVGNALHTRLAGIADRAVKGMEKVIAISVVKYINKTITDLAAYTHGVDDGADIAKHWSELKGFALGLQFNPNPVLDFDKQIELHALIGQSAVAEIETTHNGIKSDYVLALENARDLVVVAYGFDSVEAESWN